MKFKVIVHKEDEGYWAEVPSILGCATQRDTFEELLQNLYEAIEGCLLVDESEIAYILGILTTSCIGRSIIMSLALFQV